MNGSPRRRACGTGLRVAPRTAEAGAQHRRAPHGFAPSSPASRRRRPIHRSSRARTARGAQWRHAPKRTEPRHRRVRADGDPARRAGRGRHRRGGGVETLDRGDGRHPHGAHPGPGQSGARLRLPWLRLAGGERPSQARRVLRERRESRRRGSHAAHGDPRVLRHPLGGGPERQIRLLARPAGQADPPDGAASRRHPLPADRLGRRLPFDRRHATRAGLPGRGGVLHLRPHQQRDRVPLSAAGAQLRHQQSAGLLQHVPRVLRRGAVELDRDRQGLGLHR